LNTRRPARPIRVLLVDDNPADVLLTRNALKASSLRIVLSVATNGDDALSVLREHHDADNKIDLVLLDLNLPRKDGREVLAEMKQDPRLDLIPVVVFTTSESEEDIRTCYSLRANAFVTKPTHMHQFFAAVQSIEEFWTQAVQLPRAG
jgi:chemotaxis family two-component system response regulator Rcp1